MRQQVAEPVAPAAGALRAAADRTLVTGYHFPFPACGHIVKTASGYEHVPLLWNIAV